MKKIITLALALILVFTSLALPLNILADNSVGQNASVHGLISQETPLRTTAPQNNAPVSDQAIQSEQFRLFHDMTLFEPLLTEADLPGTMTLGQAEERGHIARLYAEEEDLNTVIFLNEDGTKSMYQYAAPVKFEKDGNVFDKSNKIITSELTGYSYKNKSNDVDVFFADEIGASGSKGVKVINDDINIELIPAVKQSADNVQKEIQVGEEAVVEGDNQNSPFSDTTASQSGAHAEAQSVIAEGISEAEADININTSESGASDIPAETSADSGAFGSLQTGAGTGDDTESGSVFNETASGTDAHSNNAPGNSTEAGSANEASDSVNNQSTNDTINNDASGVNDIAGSISEDTDISAQPSPHIESETTERKISCSLLTSTTAAADSILYSKVFGDSIDVRYTPTFNGFKEDIILNEYDGINTFEFILNTNGLAMIQLAGNWYLAEPGSTEPLMSLGEIYVCDSYTGPRTVESDTWEHETYNNSYAVETVTENNSYRITVTVDDAFLQAASTVYPVIVDPSFTITSAYIMDTYIRQGTPDTNYAASQSINIGYGQTYQTCRILVDFSSYAASISGFSSLSFSSAEYYMYCSSSYSSSPYVDTYMIAAKNSSEPKMWSHTTATWNSAASQALNGATLVSSRTVGGSGWYSFDISAAYSAWISSGFANSNGFLIKMRDETAASNYWRIFHSAEYTDSTKTPYMLVKYNEVSNITLSASALLMYPGETYQLSWNVTPVTAEYTFSYGHSSPNVVSMNSSGLITAHAAGSGGMQIYVTCSSTGKLYVLPVNVTVNSGSPSVQMAVYHIFNTNSCKPVTVPGGASASGSAVKQDNYSSSKAAYQKWDVIRLSNGYYVIRANYAKNFALSALNSGITIYGVGNIDDPASVPSHAQWSITASASGLYLSPQNQPSLFLQPYNLSVWAGEALECTYMNTGAYFQFIKPSDYVPTTGVTLPDVYLLKDGTYTYTPTVTPSNATFANKAMWSWGGRSSNGTQLITMPGYAWGQATTDVNAGTVQALAEGTTWVKMYCPDTNVSYTANVTVTLNREFNQNNTSALKNSVNNLLGTSPKSTLHSYTPSQCIDIILNYDTTITQYSNNFGVPKQYVQTILLRELWCYNTLDIAADEAVSATYTYYELLEDWLALTPGEQIIFPRPTAPPVIKDDSSTGLGQIFASTAITAHNSAIQNGLINDSTYSSNDWHDVGEMWENLHNNNEFNIKMVTLEIIDCARKTNLSNNYFEYSEAQIKTLLSRYNGTGSDAIQYGNECYEYYLIFNNYK